MQCLTLTIAEPWFSMIKNGIKREEYRELKLYYYSRFRRGKHFDCIRLVNGYSRLAPFIFLIDPTIEIRTGKTEWGAKDTRTLYYVITWKKLAFNL